MRHGIWRVALVLLAIAQILVLLTPVTYAGHSTTASIRCTGKTPIQVGQTIQCTATVKDTARNARTTPTGTMDWKTNSSGSFNSPTCVLSFAGAASTAGCTVWYTPHVTGHHVIIASYQGSAVMDTSAGRADIDATPAPSLENSILQVVLQVGVAIAIVGAILGGSFFVIGHIRRRNSNPATIPTV